VDKKNVAESFNSTIRSRRRRGVSRHRHRRRDVHVERPDHPPLSYDDARVEHSEYVRVDALALAAEHQGCFSVPRVRLDVLRASRLFQTDERVPFSFEPREILFEPENRTLI
jgi:hypothetical protein